MSAPPGLRGKGAPIITHAASVPGEREQGNLSNADFRSLLQRAKPKGGRSSTSEEQESKSEKELRAMRKLKKLQSFQRWQAKKAQYTEKQGSQYRDRAAERREDNNPDYKDTEDLQGEVDIEKSKFLGGDLEHTHLVKGLDYALLQKTKAALEREEEERLEKAFEESESKKQKEAQKKEEAAKTDNAPRFVTQMGRALHELLMTKPVAADKEKTSQFLPGRMIFEFELDDFASPLPTTLLQPKSDLPTSEERLSGMVSVDIRKRISKVMEYLGQGTHPKRDKEKKKKKKDGDETKMDDESSGKEDEAMETREKVAVKQEDEDQDDIFAGVDNYIPAGATTELDVRVLAERVKKERNRREVDEELAEPPVPTVPTVAAKPVMATVPDEGVARSHKAQTIEPKIVREPAAPKREQDPNYVDDIYDNSFTARGSVVVDDNSDEEDVGDVRGRIKRLRTLSEQDAKWAKQGANPQAKNSQSEQKTKDQKFEKQLQKIQQVMKDRQQEKQKKPSTTNDLGEERSQKRNKILLKAS